MRLCVLPVLPEGEIEVELDVESNESKNKASVSATSSAWVDRVDVHLLILVQGQRTTECGRVIDVEHVQAPERSTHELVLLWILAAGRAPTMGADFDGCFQPGTDDGPWTGRPGSRDLEELGMQL